jgi:choline dehydrogenase
MAPNVAADPDNKKPLGIYNGGDILSSPPDLASETGFFAFPHTINKGRRLSVLERISFAREGNGDNFMILANTLCSKLLTERGAGGSVKATGVEVIHGAYLSEGNGKFNAEAAETAAGGTKAVYKARYEVIVSAGTFETVKLMENSGIGAKAQVEALGVESVVDLPGVGENLKDRIEIPWSIQLTPEKKFDPVAFPCQLPVCYQHPPVGLLGSPYWPKEQGGPSYEDPCYAAWLAAEKEYNASAHGGKGVPMHHGVYGWTQHYGTIMTSSSPLPNRSHDIILVGVAEGIFDGYTPYSLATSPGTDSGFLTQAGLMSHTESTGSVHAKDNKPYSSPTISFKQFSDTNGPGGTSRDMVRAKDMVRQLWAHANYTRDNYKPGFDNGFVQSNPSAEILANGVDSPQVERWLAQSAWGHHACCSMAMGKADDPNAVLDGNFKVHGVDGLRVVDASIFPKIPATFITGAIYAAAEKAAEVIIASGHQVTKADTDLTPPPNNPATAPPSQTTAQPTASAAHVHPNHDDHIGNGSGPGSVAAVETTVSVDHGDNHIGDAAVLGIAFGLMGAALLAVVASFCSSKLLATPATLETTV